MNDDSKGIVRYLSKDNALLAIVGLNITCVASVDASCKRSIGRIYMLTKIAVEVNIPNILPE